MLYLIDANVLIDAAEYYYPLDRVPQFWEWLEDVGGNGSLKVPTEVYEEITGDSSLVDWLNVNKSIMVLDESPEPEFTTMVLERGYAQDLTEVAIEEIGWADPFLIAYALADPSNRCVVTMEAPKPNRKGANRHIPDVCADFNIRCINTFRLIQELDFRIRRT